MTNKERNLIKGAIRRVFSRSDARKRALSLTEIQFSDSNRPRVKKWCICPLCARHIPKYLMEVDHREPIVPLNSSLEEMSWDDVVNRTMCEPPFTESNLLAVCKECHKAKTSEERKQRTEFKRAKNGKLPKKDKVSKPRARGRKPVLRTV